jgi:hypothetical protein
VCERAGGGDDHDRDEPVEEAERRGRGDRGAVDPAAYLRLGAAAGLPLITAGLGLITGVALIGLATRLTDMPNVSPELALMIGLGVGIDHSLFIVTRFRENYLEFGDVERSVVQAMDTSGRAILLASRRHGLRSSMLPLSPARNRYLTRVRSD